MVGRESSVSFGIIYPFITQSTIKKASSSPTHTKKNERMLI